ncbi:hypothetical protein COCSADRAFT_142934 [Bipolaris sorokiniana ND90Pr]|uniref:RNA 3'-terminal phosphate cyclase domain-containing protein n=1 Tax=Cochliobolus sativus (strain ND90Pr / ATCC 201652) TaxID=665912 RepID=M2T600_COCSN|nr:uncharacterized protein COCSADRAFT_142934 [Bipolaris sorokiniana ND90Pr]EMD64432.1 hypothetical protein COCSADRAFT_142934 [Bipolaris sorokiniana ND90Pr]
MAAEEFVVLEGTHFEGGGGLIRDVLSFSSLLNRSVQVNSIRANRPGIGGLRVEHTVAIETMAYLTGAVVEGNAIASRQLVFKPHQDPKAGVIEDGKHLDITVEGSAAIFMIAMIPYILFSHLGAAAYIQPIIPKAGIELTIRAGTLCVKAPSYHNVVEVLLPTLKAIGISEDFIKLDTSYEQGWHTDYVKIPGRIKLWVKPLQIPLKAFILEKRGEISIIRLIAHAPEDEYQEFGATVKKEIEEAFHQRSSSPNPKLDIQVQTFQSSVPDQYHLLLVAETVDPNARIGYEEVFPQKSGFPEGLALDKDRLFKHLARVCIRGLINELRSGNAVDENIEDMLVIYQSLANGFSSVTAPGNARLVTEDPRLRVPLEMPSDDYDFDTKTLHRETAYWVANTMAGVTFTEKDGRKGCHGVALGSMH